jgi:hypothetical protein
MCNAPARATVKHADDYTTEDLNADVDAFRLALVRYVRARQSAEDSQPDHETAASRKASPTTGVRDG